MRRDIAARLRVPFDVVGHGRYVALSGTLFGMQLFAGSEDELRCGLRDLADLIDPGPKVDRDTLLALADEIEDYADGDGARFGRLIDRDRAKWYAHRIREALGVVE